MQTTSCNLTDQMKIAEQNQDVQGDLFEYLFKQTERGGGTIGNLRAWWRGSSRCEGGWGRAKGRSRGCLRDCWRRRSEARV